MKEEAILEVNNLSYNVGGKDIIKDINFSLKEGGFYSVIGTNGSGKTTLLRCIANSIDAKKGNIKVKGKDIKEYSAKLLAREIAMVSQYSEFLFDFSAFQIVLMGRMPYQKIFLSDSEQDLSIVEECMQKTNSWHLRDISIKELSGGEKQRVMIARALAQKTPIILLDEPISSLDIKHQFDIMELLKDINKTNNITIFIIIHNLSLALEYSDYVLALKDGLLQYFGKTKEVITPKNIKTLFEINAKIINNKNIILSNNEN